MRPRERAAVGWSFGLFFFVFSSWYAVRPVRDAMGIAGNVADLSKLFLVTLGATLAVSPLLSAMVSRLPRTRFLAVAFRLAAASLVAFALVLRGAAPSPVAARVFFVWASILNLSEIALAWALVVDVFTREQGLRFFALIGAGGTIGAMVGSVVAATLVRVAGASGTLVVAALLLEGAVLCARRAASSTPMPERALPEGGTVRWLRTALVTPYFLGICAYLALFTFSSTVLYFEQARIVKAALAGTSERTELFARIDLAANGLTLLLQLAVVGPALRRVGIGAALVVLPLVTLACFVALHVAPALGVLVACQVVRRAMDLAFAKPAREVLFTVVPPADKYKVKSFIDTFVYRSGDAFGAIGMGGLPFGAVLGTMVVACGVWAVAGYALGRAALHQRGALDA